MRYRHIWRRLARTPGFTFVTALTLALGIGANTAIFSVIEGVLLKPLPFSHPEQLITLRHRSPVVHIDRLDMCPSFYFVYREQNRTMQDAALWDSGTDGVTGIGEPQQVNSLYFTYSMLHLLGARPLLGRGFLEADSEEGNPEPVILGYGYWQSHFAGAAAAVGREIVIDDKAHQIVGVMPPDFRFLDEKFDLIRPIQLNRAKTMLGQFSYSGIARLKPGVTLAQASADIARLIPVSMDSFPPPPGYSKELFVNARIGPNLAPLKEELTGDIGKTLWILMATIGIVLLIACANVANLLLVRADGRRQELAIRAAVGASWGEIARELLLESFSLGALGGAFGLALAYAGLRLLVWLAPARLPRLGEISIDGPALLFTLVVSLAAGALFGAIPVLKYARPQVAAGLGGGGRGFSQSRERHRARSVLVVAQVALAMVLLVAAGLAIRSFAALRNVQPGFAHPEQLETMYVYIPSTQVKDPIAVTHAQQTILEKLAAIPGVTSVAWTTTIPLNGEGGWHDLAYAQDKQYAPSAIPPVRRFTFISPGLLATMGKPLVAGRDFTWSDLYDRHNVAMITENMARELWGSPPAAIGKRIRESLTAPWREVVGVVADERTDGLDKPAPSTIYWPSLMDHFSEGPSNERFVSRSIALMIRSPRAGTQSLLGDVRRAIWSVNSTLVVAEARTMQSVFDKSMAQTSFTLVMLGIAGGMALALGMIGIYGVISYSVAQRRREIGIRMAMGAQRRALAGMFLRHGLALAAIGVACGLAAAAAATRAMSSLLFEVKPLDPATFALAPLGLIAAAAFASYLPALRAATADPTESLRAE